MSIDRPIITPFISPVSTPPRTPPQTLYKTFRISLPKIDIPTVLYVQRYKDGEQDNESVIKLDWNPYDQRYETEDKFYDLSSYNRPRLYIPIKAIDITNGIINNPSDSITEIFKIVNMTSEQLECLDTIKHTVSSTYDNNSCRFYNPPATPGLALEEIAIYSGKPSYAPQDDEKTDSYPPGYLPEAFQYYFKTIANTNIPSIDNISNNTVSMPSGSVLRKMEPIIAVDDIVDTNHLYCDNKRITLMPKILSEKSPSTPTSEISVSRDRGCLCIGLYWLRNIISRIMARKSAVVAPI